MRANRSSLPRSPRTGLAARCGVATFEALETRTHLSYTPSAADRLINLDDFRADPRFSDIDGRGYAAVILDDGLDRDHPYFGVDANNNGVADRLVYSYDFADNDSNAEAVSPHGSNVTSIVGSSGTIHRGMAPGVNLIHLKVFSDRDNDGARWTDVERALKWVISNAARYNVVSVNMSLGGGMYRSAPPAQWHGIADELATLATRKILVSAAAGNDYDDTNSQLGLSYPAADPNVLAVGAVFERAFGRYGAGKSLARRTGPDRITPFSQRSRNQWMIFAPGSPISGAGLEGQVEVQNGTSQASPHVAGIVVLMQQLADRILGRRLGLAEMRTLMKQTGKKIVDGDDEQDAVVNTGATFRRIDVMRLAEAIWRKAGPELVLTQGTLNLTTGASTVSFGSTSQATSLEKTFTIANTGVRPLNISGLIAPRGFSVVSGPAGSVQPGQNTTFTLRLDGASAGAYRGEVRLITNDSDERNFTFNVTGSVSAITAVLDDGLSSVTFSGEWTVQSTGYSNDQRTAALSDEEVIFADWTFSKLIPGRYRVSATWKPDAELTTRATYLLIDSVGGLSERFVNQRRGPDDVTIGGVAWEVLGDIDVTGTELVVSLDGTFLGDGAPTGRVAADAIRIERLGPVEGDAQLFVTVGSTPTVDDGQPIAVGTTNSGRPLTKSIVLRNVGSRDLTLDGFIEVPVGFSIVGTPARVLRPGTSTTVQLKLDAGRPGNFGGALVIGSSIVDQPEFRINITGIVNPTARVIDNGDVGFAAAGSWTTSRFGYRADGLSAPGSSGATATWTFSRLTPGVYRVMATWSGSGALNPSLATNTPISVTASGGQSASRTFSQQYGPTGEQITGTWWTELLTVRVVADANAATGSMVVVLGGFADAIMVADAIRIDRIDN